MAPRDDLVEPWPACGTGGRACGATDSGLLGVSGGRAPRGDANAHYTTSHHTSASREPRCSPAAQKIVHRWVDQHDASLVYLVPRIFQFSLAGAQLSELEQSLSILCIRRRYSKMEQCWAATFHSFHLELPCFPYGLLPLCLSCILSCLGSS